MKEVFDDGVSRVAPKDECQMCLGAKGGMAGNENRIAGLIVCDYCTAQMLPLVQAYNTLHPPEQASGLEAKRLPPQLESLVQQSIASFKAMKPDEQDSMIAEQAKSYGRSLLKERTTTRLMPHGEPPADLMTEAQSQEMSPAVARAMARFYLRLAEIKDPSRRFLLVSRDELVQLQTFVTYWYNKGDIDGHSGGDALLLLGEMLAEKPQ